MTNGDSHVPFSLVAGGPFYDVLRRLGLIGADQLPLPRAGFALAVLAWAASGAARDRAVHSGQQLSIAGSGRTTLGQVALAGQSGRLLPDLAKQATRQLTRTPRVHTLRVVQRLPAVVLGIILAASAGQSPVAHTHLYRGHDHPEHQHGLAAHEHQVEAPHDSGEGVHLEGCDPGEHAVSIVLFVAPPPQAPAVDAEFVAPAPATPALQLHHTVDITDIRVHGPPRRSQASPRAPPLSIPA